MFWKGAVKNCVAMRNIYCLFFLVALASKRGMSWSIKIATVLTAIKKFFFRDFILLNAPGNYNIDKGAS